MRSHVPCALLVIVTLHAAGLPHPSASVAEDGTFLAVPLSAKEHLERELDQTVDIDFQNTRLADVVDQLRQRHQIPIHFDLEAMKAVDVSVETTVTLKLRGIRLGAGLSHLLRSIRLDWAAWDGTLRITAYDANAHYAKATLRVYPVEDLVMPPMAERYSERLADFDSLLDLITSHVAPTSWSDVGGPADIYAVPSMGLVVCDQTLDAHRQIAALIGALRRVRQRQFPNAMVRSSAPEPIEPSAIVAMRRALASPAQLVCRSMPVRDFAEWLSSSRRIPVLVDPETSPDVTITADVEGLSLRHALDLVMRPADVEAVVYDEVLHIVPAGSESYMHSDSRIYPIWDLVRGRDAKQVIDAIQRGVAPTTWEVVGGPAGISWFPNAGALIVEQEYGAQEGIASLLADLRAIPSIQSGAGDKPASPPAVEESSEPPHPAAPTPEDRLQRALAQPVEFDFQDTPLAEAAEQIRQKYGIAVHLDRVALEAVGVASSTPVTIKLRGVSLAAALRHLLRSRDLTWTTDENVLTITTVDEAEQRLVTRVHPVADLVVAPEFGAYQSEFADFGSLIDLIPSVIARTSWGDVGGPGELDAVPATGSIAFEQTLAIHDEVENLLNTLRRARQLRYPKAGPKLPVVQERPTINAIRKALAAIVDLDYDGAPLNDVLSQLARSHAIPLLIDRPALDEVGISLDSPVTVLLQGVSLKAGLRHLLRELDLIAVVYDEVLFITTRDEAEQLIEVRVYPVSDLVVPHDEAETERWDFESLEDAVIAIERTTWNDFGGPGEIEPFPNAGVAVIAQTEAIHERIGELFAGLRAARDRQFPVLPAVAEDESDDDRLHLKVYLLAGYFSGMGGGAGGGFGSSAGSVPASETEPPANAVRTKTEAVSKAAASEAHVPPGVMPQFDPDGSYEKPPRTQIGPESFTTTQLAELIKQAIEPASWKGAGGEGTIHTLPDGLLILQSNQVHRRILKLLRAMEYNLTVVNDAD